MRKGGMNPGMKRGMGNGEDFRNKKPRFDGTNGSNTRSFQNNGNFRYGSNNKEGMGYKGYQKNDSTGAYRGNAANYQQNSFKSNTTFQQPQQYQAANYAPQYQPMNFPPMAFTSFPPPQTAMPPLPKN